MNLIYPEYIFTAECRAINYALNVIKEKDIFFLFRTFSVRITLSIYVAINSNFFNEAAQTRGIRGKII